MTQGAGKEPLERLMTNDFFSKNKSYFCMWQPERRQDHKPTVSLVGTRDRVFCHIPGNPAKSGSLHTGHMEPSALVGPKGISVVSVHAQRDDVMHLVRAHMSVER